MLDPPAGKRRGNLGKFGAEAERAVRLSQLPALALGQLCQHLPLDLDTPPPLPLLLHIQHEQPTPCRPSDNPCARRSPRPRPGRTQRARRSTPRPSRTCASTATPRCCSRASPASRERECSAPRRERAAAAATEASAALIRQQLPRTAGHRVRYATLRIAQHSRLAATRERAAIDVDAQAQRSSEAPTPRRPARSTSASPSSPMSSRASGRLARPRPPSSSRTRAHHISNPSDSPTVPPSPPPVLRRPSRLRSL